MYGKYGTANITNPAFLNSAQAFIGPDLGEPSDFATYGLKVPRLWLEYTNVESGGIVVGNVYVGGGDDDDDDGGAADPAHSESDVFGRTVDPAAAREALAKRAEALKLRKKGTRMGRKEIAQEKKQTRVEAKAAKLVNAASGLVVIGNLYR